MKYFNVHRHRNVQKWPILCTQKTAFRTRGEVQDMNYLLYDCILDVGGPILDFLLSIQLQIEIFRTV